ENGGSGLALAVERQDIKSLTSALALEITKALSMRWGVLQSSGRVEWEHEFEDDDRLVTSRFVADPRIPFSISSDVPDRNYFNLGFALSATLPRGLAAFASYETVLGQDTIRKHTIDFGVRKEF
ncbi:MAG: autotransporter outer membrane beta-barrel domain-containing protein, partial [Gammaproteobacteria bacterium]|nr:autotransporter outer membrane beta-barrel domain-containing protein [Gammaproteobacteria bacterium]